MNTHTPSFLSVTCALRKIDSPSILFFLGILLSVAALQSAGILSNASRLISDHIANDNIIVITMGLLSSVVDNVPLVAAAQGMYGVDVYPTDHYFWEFLPIVLEQEGAFLLSVLLPVLPQWEWKKSALAGICAMSLGLH